MSSAERALRRGRGVLLAAGVAAGAGFGIACLPTPSIAEPSAGAPPTTGAPTVTIPAPAATPPDGVRPVTQGTGNGAIEATPLPPPMTQPAPTATDPASSATSGAAAPAASSAPPPPRRAPAPAHPEVVKVGDNQLSCDQLAGEINALAAKANPSQLLADAGWRGAFDAPADPKPPAQSGNSTAETAGQVIAGAAPLIIGAMPVFGIAGAVFGAAVDAMQQAARPSAEAPLGGETAPASRVPTAQSKQAEEAYIAQQRREHLTSIFNAKGC